MIWGSLKSGRRRLWEFWFLWVGISAAEGQIVVPGGREGGGVATLAWVLTGHLLAPSLDVSDPASLALEGGVATQALGVYWVLIGTNPSCVRPSLMGACPLAPSVAVSDAASWALVLGHQCFCV